MTGGRLILARDLYREDGVFGDLIAENGSLDLLTLEHSYGLLPKIPAGEYICKRSVWHKKGIPTFEITGVPNATRILFHTGNKEQDSEGCVLLGLGRLEGNDGVMIVTDSKTAHKQFMAYFEGCDEFPLTIL
jgi:hypothetical protein